ncbi:MAG: flagellar motor switch protein FliG [Planctomycetota bacterium]|nr:MAG: flagellar motor switch protein FliG [Planctomycetota bacterium]
MAKASQDSALTGLKKAAILLVSLDTTMASNLLSNMDTETIEKISMEIARLGEIPRETREKTLEEFYNTVLAAKYIDQGGVDYARVLLEKALPTELAGQILNDLNTSIQQVPFHFLHRADPDNLFSFIESEHPQTIALILAHLEPTMGASILGKLSPKNQIEVVKRIAKMEQTTPEAIKEVEKSLEIRLSAIVSQDLESSGGIESVSSILNLADRTTEKGILENLEEEDPELVEEIRRLMFVFEDIQLVDDKGMQSVVKEIEQDDLALALKSASEELKNKIFNSMSERASDGIKESMDFMGPVKVADVETAQQKIVDVVRRLEESGDLIISGKGGGDEIIV